MKIIACYIVCNEETLIADSIRSVKAYVDGFVIYDSAFIVNPISATHSTDRTREICEKVCVPLPLTYIEATEKTTLQTARTRCQEQVAEGDWVLIIDADECLYGNHKDILAILEQIKTGQLQKVVSFPVYTTAVLFHGMGKDMPPDQYELNPVINTGDYMTRFFQNEKGMYWQDLGLRDKTGYMVIDGKRNRTDKMFIINHHTRQRYDYYVNNCIREIAERKNLLSVLAKGSHLR